MPTAMIATSGAMFEPSSSPALNSRSAYRNSAAPAIATMPAARPSSPSMRLIAFAITTTHEHGDERREVGREHDVLVARERHAEVEHRDAEAATSMLPRSTWPGDLRRRRHLAEVVDARRRRTSRRAASSSPSGSELSSNISWNWSICDATAIAARNPTNIAAPPSVGVGFVCTCARVRSRRTTAPNRIASHRTSGRQQERDAERDRRDDRSSPPRSRSGSRVSAAPGTA